MKPWYKSMLLPLVLSLLPMTFGLALYDQLPAQIPSHWQFDGTVDGYMPKVAMVFGMPLFLAAMTGFVAFMLTHDPKKANQAQALKALSLWIGPVLSLLLIPLSLLTALGYALPIVTIVTTFVGVLFIILGNFLPKTKQNYTMGIRLPWTLNSTENWNRTHRFAGKVWVLGGLMFVVCNLAAALLGATNLSSVGFCVITALALLPCGYSYWLFKQGI